MSGSSLPGREACRRPACAELRRAAALLVLALSAAGTWAAGPAPPIAVIVGRGESPAAPLSQTLVAGIFARKRQLWDDRSNIVPVNLPADHPLRRQFSVSIFARTPEGLQDYWADQYFHGVLPPPVLGSEEAVMRFVASTPGAIGYVSSCSVDKRVDVVATIPSVDGNAPCKH